MPDTIFNPETLVEKGYCEVPVTEEGEEAAQLYYELHGSRDPSATRIVFIMGLNASSFAWLKQVTYFASLPNISVLVFDNRGSGNSSSPKGLYSTKQMAADALVLLDHIGWKEKRSLVVVGASLGGMIAMDLARLAPQRISTLVLSSTKSGYKWNYPTLRTAWTMSRFLMGTVWTKRQSLKLTINLMFPKSFMNLTVKDVTGRGRTYREILEQEFSHRLSLSKKAPPHGRIGQLAAVFRHRMTAEELTALGNDIPRIAIIQGDTDKIVRKKDADLLAGMIPGSHYTVCEGVGHGLVCSFADMIGAFDHTLALS
ncbi:alpha/beta-hydrolase [Meredithblackwellia eburnea MCA 4105]